MFHPDIKDFWEKRYGTTLGVSQDEKQKTVIYFIPLPEGGAKLVGAFGRTVNQFSFPIPGKGSFKKNQMYYFFENEVKTEEIMLKIIKLTAFL